MVVIGATNRPILIDPALLRPGRFDELVYVRFRTPPVGARSWQFTTSRVCPSHTTSTSTALAERTG